MWRLLHRILYLGGLGIIMLSADVTMAEDTKFSWTISGVTDSMAPTVILLHGLNRSHRSMRPLAEALAAGGYRVVNMDYPASKFPLDELARLLGRALDSCCTPSPGAGFNFITHSLGGIVLRVYAEQQQHRPMSG